MATKNSSKNMDASLVCDLCGSQDIIETREGYVCRACGVVLELKKLEYYKPYNVETLQNAVSSTPTQIGTKRERMRYPNNLKFNQLNKLQSIKDSEKAVLGAAMGEIRRIFANAQLPNGYRDLVFKKFKVIRSKLRPGTKYRSVKKLVPIVTYYCLKKENIPVSIEKLLEISEISESEFRGFQSQYSNFDREYKKRNRIKFILKRVYEVKEHFNLGMPFYFQSKKVLLRLWDGISNTKDDVVAGLVSSISVLCWPQPNNELSINAICKKLGIKMSTIQFQVKNKIFRKFRVDGFETLKKSSDLLKKILAKIGLFQEIKDSSERDAASIIEVKLGQTDPVFNYNNNLDYYLFAFKENDQNSAYLSLNPWDEENEISTLSEKIDSPECKNPECKPFDVKMWKYNSGKGPPLFREV